MKTKEQKRKEALERQEPRFYASVKKPFICGNYTQHDWELLIKYYKDWEAWGEAWSYQKTLEDQYDFLVDELLNTKPKWA